MKGPQGPFFFESDCQAKLVEVDTRAINLDSEFQFPELTFLQTEENIFYRFKKQ